MDGAFNLDESTSDEEGSPHDASSSFTEGSEGSDSDDSTSGSSEAPGQRKHRQNTALVSDSESNVSIDDICRAGEGLGPGSRRRRPGRRKGGATDAAPSEPVYPWALHPGQEPQQTPGLLHPRVLHKHMQKALEAIFGADYDVMCGAVFCLGSTGAATGAARQAATFAAAGTRCGCSAATSCRAVHTMHRACNTSRLCSSSGT